MSVSIATTSLTMSSREIAELMGKAHRNVVRDIEKMLNVIGKDVLNFEHIYHDSYGRDQKEYRLPKNLTINLVAGYRPDLRLKIIDRWLELEQQAQPRVPTTLSEALRLAAEKAERVELLEPKAAALDAISQSQDDLGVRDAGRELGIGQTRLARLLIERRWACREGSRSKLKAAHYGLSNGYVRFVTRCYTDPHTGEDRLSDVMVLTRKGLTRMAETVAKEGIPA
ncbi:phage regulatory protein/antirepressor Ant [Bombella sp. TMW 2.2559]|uniref:Phage regulatory protein/antirepressor Ant n=1 Tax=Bombella dulcis TaxID=2967339 RepID=A0ABT3WAR4_9PROT|nr:phage regulatory protein/antirepressor Ant [Bombella dulcis]MCX5615375.1 phage regulatory protein/antirepressor Ant [Bombella dulcis]